MCRLTLVDNLANHLGEEHKNLFYELVFSLDQDEKDLADKAVAKAKLWPDVVRQINNTTVLDPACGSGSFLIKAYHVLADFYRRMNQGIVQEQTKLVEGFASADMFERLQRISHLPQQVLDYPQVILKEHLYGVDLDAEAAEIATVNLTMQAFADSRQTKLPRILNENIKVGNSLVGCWFDRFQDYPALAWAREGGDGPKGAITKKIKNIL